MGWGRLCQFNAEGVTSTYLFKNFVMSHNYTDLPEERRKRVGNEVGRLREVNLKISLIEGLYVCLPVGFQVRFSPFPSFSLPPHRNVCLAVVRAIVIIKHK